MRKSTKQKLLFCLLGLFVLQGALQRGLIYNFWSENYRPKQGAVAEGLSPDQLLFALAGFREMIAGLLWVRADSFFETGNYDAILPIIRLVTILDPHQIDVYATGMWHIAYNFTDEEQRSDRRYIPSALALGKEGCRNNPNTYELFFETGWLWYHKIEDFHPKAVEYFEKANERKDILPARRNLLVWAYQRNGEVEKSLDFIYKLYNQAAEAYAQNDKDYSRRTQMETIEGNIDNTIVRMVQRGYLAKKRGESLTGYDVDPPFDVGFSARVRVMAPRVLQVDGTYGVLPVGTRIRIVLRDIDYPNAVPGALDWDKSSSVNLDPPADFTFMQDQLYVRNQRFNRKIDMSKDPTQYPFRKESNKYLIEFYYSPRNAPPHIQDKFSWNGEGFTDKNFLNTEIRPGVRVLYTNLEISRDQLLRQGEWENKTPILKTKNFVESTKEGGDVIDVPSLRQGN